MARRRPEPSALVSERWAIIGDAEWFSHREAYQRPKERRSQPGLTPKSAQPGTYDFERRHWRSPPDASKALFAGCSWRAESVRPRVGYGPCCPACPLF